VYPYSLATMTSKYNHVDLRYPNGFAASQMSSASNMKSESKRQSGRKV